MDSVLLNATKNLLSPEKPVIVSIQNRKFKCPYCEQKFERKKLPIHIQNQHEELIPEGHTALRIAFNSINHKTEGHCIICKNVSDWNENKGRYERLCNNPKCHEEYKKIVAERNKKKYGTERLQTDPKYAKFVQTRALAGRSISGNYKFTDGGVISYVGSYEKKLLEFMDIVMHCKSEDIVSPGPAIDYFLDGQKHLYIPDFFYEPYQLLIEIKDGGSNPNNHPHRIEEEKKNKAKEAAVKKLNKYSYVRVVNNDFSQLLTAMAILKYNMIDNDSNPIIMTHESAILESEQKSILEKDYKQKGSMKLSDFKLEVKERDNSDKTLKRLVLEWKENRKLVATVTVDKSAREEDGLWYRWFGHFNVNKSYRGYGLGKQIVEFIKKKYKAGALAVYKDNEIAVKLYKQCGFIIGKETDTSYWMYFPPNREKVYNESMILESEDKSVLEKDHKQKGSMKLSDLKLEIKEKKYNEGVLISLHWKDKSDKLVCWASTDKYPASDGYRWFGDLEVSKQYRGYGLGKQIIEFIKSKYKAGALGVAKDNEIAIRLYKQCEFRELERKDPKGKYLYLYYPPNREKNIEKINEVTKIKRIKELYFISDKDFDNKILKPRVPNHLSNRRGEEENKTGRICFAPTIKECLRAIPQEGIKNGKEFYVHIPKGKYTVYRPSTKEVADSVVTNEHWICEPVKLECIGKIKLTDKYDSGEIFSYKGEDFTVYDWNYKWIENETLSESLEEIDINQKFIGSDKQSAIISLNKILNDFNYGIIVNGKIITNNINFDHYKTLSYKDFLKYKTGVCWDYTQFEAIYFTNNLGMKLTKDELRNNTFSMYYMEFDDEDGDQPTHTWLGYKLDNKIYAFESSWKQYKGITEFESENDMIQTYIERQKDFYNNIKNPIYNPKIIKYSPMKKSGLTCEVFMSIVHKEGKIIFRETNIDSLDKSTLIENWIFNDDDLYYNKDKFDSGEINLCFIVGNSGSGKTTMSTTYEKESEIVHLDDLYLIKEVYPTLNDLKKQGQLMYSFFTTVGKKYYIGEDEWKNKKVPIAVNTSWEEYRKELYITFINYAMKYAKVHKSEKFVLEGVWILADNWFEPKEFRDYAFYIKGTSAIISRWRAIKRDSKEYGFKKGIYYNIDGLMSWYIPLEKRLKYFRNYFEKQMEQNESMLNESILFNDEDLYYNKDKFDSGEINLCFITGHSGSGKTTMGNEYKSKNTEVVNMDHLLVGKKYFPDLDSPHNNLVKSFFSKEGSKYYLDKEELRELKINQEYYSDYLKNLFRDFVNYAKKYANKEKNRKFIIEGIWLICSGLFKPQDFKDYAFYLKGTSLLISKIRADRRDNKGIIRFLTRNWKFYYIREKHILEFRNYFENLMKQNEILESTLLENWIFNDDDLYYNKDKFDSGEINLCFITGHSGSGKTTMGKNWQKSSNVEHYDLDDLQAVADHFTLSQLKKYGELYFSFFTGIGKKYYLTSDELFQMFEKGIWSKPGQYECEMYRTFIPYAMKYAKAHRNIKFVLDGIWIYCDDWFKPEEFKEYAVYIKGTSMLVSKIRAAKRDKKGIIKFLSRSWKFYHMSEKRLQEFRRYFEKLMKKNEALELSNPIDTIVFDIGKVLTHRNPEGEKLISQWTRKHHLTDEDMNNLWAAWDGHKDDYKEHQSLKNAKVLFREFVAPEYHHLVNDWFTMLGKCARIVADYVKPMLSTLKKKGYKLYFLSNMRQYIYEILQEANKFGSIKKYFSGGIYSFQTPYRKPDVNIYKILIDKYQINPETSLFIDDKPENVEAARSLGFNGLVFEGDAFSTSKNNPIIRDLISLKPISSSINEVIENMSGTIGAALPPGGSIPYYPNKNNYYVIQYPLNNVFAYGITSDPLQNTIYGVEYLDNNQYKVYKTDKTKIGKNYLTYKIKDTKHGEELYNELASCIQYNKRKFYDSCKNPQQYIYERLSENSNISLQFDQAFELVPNPNLEVKQLCNEIYSYLKQPSNLQLLEKQINSLSKRQTINEDTNNGTDQETQKASNSTEIPKEFYNDWDLKKKRAAEAETMGMIIMVPKNMTPSIITKNDIDELKSKHEKLQSITSHKRVLSNTTASSIFGVNNDRLYNMILSAYSHIM